MKQQEIKLRHGYRLSVRESAENSPQGVIIDVYDKEEECVDSFTFWYQKGEWDE